VLEELSLLLDLQTIDNQIADVLRWQEQIPEDLQLCNEEYERIEQQLKEEEQLLFDKQKARRSLEGELEAENDKLQRYQRQLFEVKNNKEYQALLHEIKIEKDKIGKLEDQILMLLEEIDAHSKDFERAQLLSKDEKEACKKRETELRQKLRELEDELVVREDERRRVIAKMKPELVGRYERIRKGRGGVAVVTINGGTCTGCFTALPPQFVSEVRKGDQILTCEHCGRMLIWRDG